MSDKRQIVERIDVGPDCVLIYRVGDRISLVVTTCDNGDAEVFLDSSQCVRVIEALAKAGED